jgi:phosphotransferase system  glucose/maltose/N-acetylglucosamine-specific IIC component
MLAQEKILFLIIVSVFIFCIVFTFILRWLFKINQIESHLRETKELISNIEYTLRKKQQ